MRTQLTAPRRVRSTVKRRRLRYGHSLMALGLDSADYNPALCRSHGNWVEAVDVMRGSFRSTACRQWRDNWHCIGAARC
jgi:hypothetical protein